jgi:hypothetical protein
VRTRGGRPRRAPSSAEAAGRGRRPAWPRIPIRISRLPTAGYPIGVSRASHDGHRAQLREQARAGRLARHRRALEAVEKVVTGILLGTIGARTVQSR